MGMLRFPVGTTSKTHTRHVLHVSIQSHRCILTRNTVTLCIVEEKDWIRLLWPHRWCILTRNTATLWKRKDSHFTVTLDNADDGLPCRHTLHNIKMRLLIILRAWQTFFIGLSRITYGMGKTNDIVVELFHFWEGVNMRGRETLYCIVMCCIVLCAMTPMFFCVLFLRCQTNN